LVSKLLGDRYLRWGRVRPYHETAASEAARKRGIPTPRVVAAAMYPEGAFYRADLVTDFVSDSSDLVETLFDDRRKGPGGAGERLDALRATGELIRKLASVGIRHRDLHARNVLLEWQGAAPTAHLLDLDRCEVGREGTQISPVSMHQRLRRSLLKWTHGTGIRLSEREWDALERAAVG
jgi:3-deoxy-D-manno-octulosonic acid kinase